MTVKEALEIAKLSQQIVNGERLDTNSALYKKLKQSATDRDIALYYVIQERVDTALGVLAKETIKLKKKLDNKKKRGTIKK